MAKKPSKESESPKRRTITSRPGGSVVVDKDGSKSSRTDKVKTQKEKDDANA